MGYKIGINASRNRSGGARNHIINILKHFDPKVFNIDEVHIWSYNRLLQEIPNISWLYKHNPIELEQPLLLQIIWELINLEKEIKEVGCDILLNTDAGSLCSFRPSVTMSRDLLPFDRNEIKRYPLGLSRLRLILLRFISSRSLRKSDGVIFLSRYAYYIIKKYIGFISNYKIIPHGISGYFYKIESKYKKPFNKDKHIRCIYIADIQPYKNHENVLSAVSILRKKSIPIIIELIGIREENINKIKCMIKKIGLEEDCVIIRGLIPHEALASILTNSNIFIFASSCENFPNTLLEGMASGVPIVCSNVGPMPEILKDGGLYFDPRDPGSIAKAIEDLLNDNETYVGLSKRAREISFDYSWERCANETFSYLINVIERRKSDEKTD